MSETIEPALTPDEWAWWQSGTNEWREIARTPNGRVHVDPRRYREAKRPTLIMALANAALPDGDPRKITRADVQRLRQAIVAAAHGMAGDGGNVLDPDETEPLERLAAKLADLLPPEGG